MWDTAGQEDYDKLRPVGYDKVNILFFIFDRSNPISLENIKSKWIQEANANIKNPRLVKILVENKCDLESACLSPSHAVLLDELRSEMDYFVKTSAVSYEGIHELFEKSLEIYERKNRRTVKCNLFRNPFSKFG